MMPTRPVQVHLWECLIQISHNVMSDLLETALEQPKLFDAITKKARALRGTVPNLWLTVEDLAQAGWIAASESVDYFDPKHDVDIFDFLVMQAKHAMQHAIERETKRLKENNKHGVEIVYSTTVAEAMFCATAIVSSLCSSNSSVLYIVNYPYSSGAKFCH